MLALDEVLGNEFKLLDEDNSLDELMWWKGKSIDALLVVNEGELLTVFTVLWLADEFDGGAGGGTRGLITE